MRRNATCALAFVTTSVTFADTLWDNGGVSGIGGYSNATSEVFGFRRTLLDDFLVPEGETWRLSAFHHHHLYNTLPPGSGTGMDLAIWTDDDGRPGEFAFAVDVVEYSEVETGRTYFSRHEAQSWTTFEPFDLGPGHYWFEAAVIGPENNFWLLSERGPLSECWVNYEDFDGLRSGRQQFGVEADLAWSIAGQRVRPLTFVYPSDRPVALDPCGAVVETEILSELGHALDHASPMLHYDAGAGFVAVPMKRVSFLRYDAVFPPVTCGDRVVYYLSARTLDGITVTDPPDAPTRTFDGVSATGVETVFADDMEEDRGWTVESEEPLTGVWERGIPAGQTYGAPLTDYDGSGRCWVTDLDDEVDGGPTRLISPAIDLSGKPEAMIEYARWFKAFFPHNDHLDVHVSNDDGRTWSLAEQIDDALGWQVSGFRAGDVVAPLTDVMRLRFTADDLPADSLTEAAIDTVEVVAFVCLIPGDVDGDRDVDFADLLLVLAAWGPCSHPGACPEDLNGDAFVDFADILILLAGWGACP